MTELNDCGQRAGQQRERVREGREMRARQTEREREEERQQQPNKAKLTTNALGQATDECLWMLPNGKTQLAS